MQLRFPETELRNWARQYSYGREETELAALRETVQRQGYLSKDQLTLLARWKSARSAPRVKGNSEAFVQEITGFALTARDERSRIEALTLLDGVLWPTASVVLHFFHSEKYPLLDFRALWSLQTDQPPCYDFEFWWQYVQVCRKLSEKNELEMRELDRALWQYSKIHQPRVESERLIAAFEGGSVHTTERNGQYLVIINETAALEMLDEEDREGIGAVRELPFPSAAARDEYIKMRGWSGVV
ncbi:hypothetical protein MASR1M8_00140 [Thermomonas brevis]